MKFPEQFRVQYAGQYSTNKGDSFGMFRIPSMVNNRWLKVIACDEYAGWEHVSVSLPDHPKRTPTWEEMCLVKGLFWDETECVVQFHPPESEYVNTHKGCLHLWKCVNQNFPTPPKIMV